VSDCARSGGRALQSRPRLSLKQDLLRDPSHYERKSNQKEEARSCTGVFPVSHSLSSGSRLVGSVRRSIKPSGNSQCQNRAENDFAIVRANARVVPLRVLNGRLTASSIDKPIVGSWLATAASSPFATRALLTWRIRSSLAVAIGSYADPNFGNVSQGFQGRIKAPVSGAQPLHN
jgi:hypothetical protein